MFETVPMSVFRVSVCNDSYHDVFVGLPPEAIKLTENNVSVRRTVAYVSLWSVYILMRSV